MNKYGQDYSTLYDPGLSGKTLNDVYAAIRADAGLAPMEKLRLTSAIDAATAGTPKSTPLSALRYTVFGGALGWIISKYFGLGFGGQLVASVLGVGLGKALSNAMTANKPWGKGWRELG